MMKYRLYPTKAKTARVNGLTPVISSYYAGNDLYYDFSILDGAGLDPSDLEAVKRDFMEHHAVSWYSDPLPTICQLDKFSNIVGQIDATPHRVYRQDGKRIMVIVEATRAHLEKQERQDVWSEYKTMQEYNARTTAHIDGDYEIGG